MLAAPRRILLVAALIVCAAGLLAAGAGRARAGAWTLVGCTQPNGQPAATDGWTTGWWGGGSATLGSGDANTCATPGGSLAAVSSQNGPAASYTGPEWVFTAPGGATIAGGSVTASLTSPQGQTWIGTPGPAYDGADIIANCQLNAACGANGTESGSFPIDHPGGTSLYAPALCVDSGSTCPLGSGVNAEVSITQALIELTVDAVPAGTNFRGALLSPRARGTANLVFTASDPGATGGFGPGVYAVTVQIDGTTVYSGVPDTNDGECVALGTDATTGGLMFDHEQPCAPQAKLRIPVQTAGLSDGRHQLTVAQSDAAGDTATVLSRYITTFNPVTTPRPRRRGEVDARLSVGWRFDGARTHIDSVRTRALPRRGTVTVACRGRRCPRLRVQSVPVARVGGLWTELKHATLHAGDRLMLTIRAPHRHPEPIEFHIRSGRTPTARLLRSR